MARVRAFDLEAYDHQDLPFERVVEALHPARSLARHPLFQVMLVLQNAPGPGSDASLPGLAVDSQPLVMDVAKFDLTLGLGERLGAGGEPLGIEGSLEYSLDLFDRAAAENIVARFVRLLEQAVESPDVPLHRLAILEAAERQPAARWLQRHGASGARGDPAGAVRGPGGPDASRGGGGLRPGVSDLCRARTRGLTAWHIT